MSNKPVFKPYSQHQQRIFFGFDDMIPQGHVVRVVNNAIDKMDMSALVERYPGGGTSSYNPVMLLKVLIYAYVDKIFSSRRIAKATRENIYFMWLSGNTVLDHMTINRFRGERLNGIIEDIFAEVVALLMKEGYISFDKYFLDGTKIEANANKYSWVWGKNTKRFKKNLRKKCVDLLKEINLINEEENNEYGTYDLEETGNGKPINSEAIEEAVKQIDEKLKSAPKDKKLSRAKKTIEKDYLPRMKKYEGQEELLEERKSYSKTDTDATFMRMKEDYMKNGQLKPGFNVQTGSENQFVTGFSIHQRPGDTSCLKEHLEKVKQMHGKLPQNVIADAGYGSEENYEYLLSENIIPYVKYNTFHKEASKKWREDITKVQNFVYDEKEDVFYCGYNRPLIFMHERKTKSDNGYESLVRVYECLNCDGCPHKGRCVKSDQPFANRSLYVNRRLNELKELARQLLTGETGLEMRSKRPIEIESVFGNIKGNFGVRRFLLRGLQKVTVEWGLHCIAQNMRKMVAVRG